MPAPGASRLSSFLRRPEVWVFLVALAARLWVLGQFSESPHFGVQGGDSKFYHDWALRILRGEWTDHHAFYGLPGYAFLLAGIYALSGVEPFSVIGLQCVLEAGTALVIFILARGVIEAEREPRGGIAAGALAALGWVCYIPAQTFSVILMPTSWLVAAYWACAWWALRLRRGPAVWPWSAMGVAIGAVAMLVASCSSNARGAGEEVARRFERCGKGPELRVTGGWYEHLVSPAKHDRARNATTRRSRKSSNSTLT